MGAEEENRDVLREPLEEAGRAGRGCRHTARDWAPIPIPAQLREDAGSPTELPTEHRTVKHTLEQAKIHQVPWEHGEEQLHIQAQVLFQGFCCKLSS